MDNTAIEIINEEHFLEVKREFDKYFEHREKYRDENKNSEFYGIIDKSRGIINPDYLDAEMKIITLDDLKRINLRNDNKLTEVNYKHTNIKWETNSTI